MPNLRIPNLLHFLAFIALILLSFALCEGSLVAVTHHHFGLHATLDDQRLQLIVNIFTYLFAILLASLIFPLFWHRPLLTGLRWNSTHTRPALAGLGLAMGFAAQSLTVFIPHPKDLPIDLVFRNPKIIWALLFFAVILGPFFEEVVFRGFLLPAIANAVDWTRVPRNRDPTLALEKLDAWRDGTTWSRAAVVFSTLITSLLFALLHGAQLGWTWPAIALLATVSVVLCIVRIRTASLAASTLVHSCYNLSIFITLFIATSGFRHLDRV